MTQDRERFAGGQVLAGALTMGCSSSSATAGAAALGSVLKSVWIAFWMARGLAGLGR